MSPAAKLHKSAVKVVHAFCLCARAHHVTPPLPLLLVYLGELWCQLKKNKKKKGRKQGNISYLTWVTVPDSCIVWMCSNGLPEQHQYFFLLDSIFGCGTRAHPVMRGAGVLSRWDVLKALIAMNSLPCGAWQKHDFCCLSKQALLWHLLGLVRVWLSEVRSVCSWGNHSGQPSVVTFTWMCVVLCRRDVGQRGLTPADRGLGGLGSWSSSRVVLLSALLMSEPLRARLAVVAAAVWQIVLSHPPNMINRN